jgi:hypothetical protein
MPKISENCYHNLGPRVEAANHPFVRAADEYLRSLEAVDAALIFETQSSLDQVPILPKTRFSQFYIYF